MIFDQKRLMICWNRGESSFVEFKSKEVHSESIAKGMVAFSNSQGGVILIGVSDKGEVESISGDNNYEEWVANIARKNMRVTKIKYFVNF